jgi:hypothetical protein
MNASIIQKQLVARVTGEIHSIMFHGEQERTDIRVPPGASGSHYIGDDLSSPLLVSRNVYKCPDVFMPGTSLIVSASVRQPLIGLPEIVFLRVEFAKLYYFPYVARDFSFYESSEYRRSPSSDAVQHLVDSLEDQKEAHQTIGAYYEIVTNRYVDVLDCYSNHKTVRFLDGDPDGGWYEELLLTAAMVKEHPFLLTPFGHLVDDAVLSPVTDFFDWDYFRRVRISI